MTETVVPDGYPRLDRGFMGPERAAARVSAEPQRMYADTAAALPVLRNADGSVTLLKMADILAVNKSRDVQQAAKFLGSNRPAIPLGLDGPEHTKYRRLLDPVFTPKRIGPLADQVRDLAGRMIDGFLADGQVDAYAAWCEPLPSSIFLSILGLPQSDLSDFLHFKDLTLGSAGADLSVEQKMAHRAEAVQWIQAYFNRTLDERLTGSERDDMLGWLITTEVDGQRLTREETLDILGLLMIAGLDTVAASLSCFLSYFARQDMDRGRILADPALIGGAVEELLRFESPVTDGGRIAKADLELPSGEKVAQGTVMNVSWSAANLDPEFFADPLRVNFERTPNPHIAFASGFHRCLGSHLARMELRVALEVWHERIPHYRIATDEPLVYTINPRGAHHLPLAWG